MEFGFAATFGIFCLVYGLIVFRNIRGTSVPIWAAMTAGAILVLIFGIVSPQKAFSSINFDVILFLLGMFVLVSGLDSSGMLEYITNKILSFAKTPNQVLFVIIFVMGILSAFLINDTIALVATPIVLGLAKSMRLRPAPLLICLAFGITIGSVMTPMGNPQNLLVSLHSGMGFPLLNFLRYLILPTVASLAVTFFIVRRYYRQELRGAVMPVVSEDPIPDQKLAKRSSVLVILTVIGFFVIGIIKMLGVQTELNFAHVAIFGGIAMLAIGTKRRQIISRVNWQILVFFVSMFVFVQGLVDGGMISAIQNLLPLKPTPGSPLATLNIIGASVAFSQIVSNVPFVAIYMPIMQSYGFAGVDTVSWIALASASTIAGNLTILGAASTVIILQIAGKKNGSSFSFVEFFKIGSVVTAANVAVLVFFLVVI